VTKGEQEGVHGLASNEDIRENKLRRKKYTCTAAMRAVDA